MPFQEEARIDSSAMKLGSDKAPGLCSVTFVFFAFALFSFRLHGVDLTIEVCRLSIGLGLKTNILFKSEPVSQWTDRYRSNKYSCHAQRGTVQGVRWVWVEFGE